MNAWTSISFYFQMFLIWFAAAVIGAIVGNDIFMNACLLLAIIHGLGGSILSLVWRRTYGDAEAVNPWKGYTLSEFVRDRVTMVRGTLVGAWDFIKRHMPSREAVAQAPCAIS